MKKSGFTITEILAVIVILAVLIVISIPIYNNMKNNTLKKEYYSKVSYIESKVLEYAEANNLNGSEIISVGRLINQGYITADRYEEDMPIIDNPDPEKKEGDNNLACRIAKIEQDNYTYSAKLTDEWDCELINMDTSASELGVIAFEVDTVSGGYKLTKPLSIINGELPWTNKNVLIEVNPVEYDEITISSAGTSKSVKNKLSLNLNQTTTEDNLKDKAAILIKAQNLVKSEVMISVKKKYDDKEEIKNAKLTVKIDKEKPIINTSVSDKWSKDNKDSKIYVSDGSGSGAKCVYETTSSTPPIESTCTGSGVTLVENGVAPLKGLSAGTHYIWAVDKAGNMTITPTQLLVQNIDNQGPECDYQGERTRWDKTNVTVRFGCKDNVGCTAPNNYKTFDNSNTNGTVKIDPYIVKDITGTEFTCDKDAQVYIDKVAPTITAINVTSQDPNYNTSTVNISALIADAHSGLLKYCINTSSNTSGCTWNNITTINESRNEGKHEESISTTMNLGAYDGSSYIIYVHVIDKVGNENQAHSLSRYVVYKECSKKTSLIKTECTDCSKKCDGGKQDCTDYYNDLYLSGVACNEPRPNQDCNTMGCCSRINYTPWSECSAACEGYQSKQAYSFYDESISCSESDQTQACGADCCSQTKEVEVSGSSTIATCPKCSDTANEKKYVVTYQKYSTLDPTKTCGNTYIKEFDCNEPSCCSQTKEVKVSDTYSSDCPDKCGKGDEEYKIYYQKISTLDSSKTCGVPYIGNKKSCDKPNCCSKVYETGETESTQSSCPSCLKPDENNPIDPSGHYDSQGHYTMFNSEELPSYEIRRKTRSKYNDKRCDDIVETVPCPSVSNCCDDTHIVDYGCEYKEESNNMLYTWYKREKNISNINGMECPMWKCYDGQREYDLSFGRSGFQIGSVVYGDSHTIVCPDIYTLDTWCPNSSSGGGSSGGGSSNACYGCGGNPNKNGCNFRPQSGCSGTEGNTNPDGSTYGTSGCPTEYDCCDC